MPAAWSVAHKKIKDIGQALISCALAASFVWPQPARAESLTWRDGLSEGERRLERKELEPAEACFRQALRDVKSDPSAGPDDVALCMERLANVLQTEDITDESLPLYKKALKILSRAHGSRSAALLPDLMAEGLIFEGEGQFKQAIKIYQRAVDIAAQAPGASLTLADCQHSLGRTQFKNNQARLAEPLYRSCLALIMEQKGLPSNSLLHETIADYTDLLEKTYGPGKNLPSDVRSELLQDRLSQLPRNSGVPDSSFEKEVSLRFAKEALNQVPPSSPLRGTEQQPSGADIAVPSMPAAKHLDDFAAAQAIDQQRIVFYQRMIGVDIESLGAEHPSVARDLSGLGAVYMAAHRYEEAKTLFMRALKIYEKVYGGDALLVKRTRSMLELLCQDQSAEESGNSSGSNFVADLAAIPLAAQKLDIAISLNYLAALCYSLGKVDDAEKVYSWALADTYLTTGRESLLLAAVLKDYARVLRSAGNTSRAEILEGDAGAISRSVLSGQALRRYQ
jgi:tetratricopeptide (TPR) repeat protein